MKITRIETHVCHARMRNWVFVKVVTDQDGLFGWGEATLEWHTRAVVGAVEDLAELLVGEDPTRIEHLWQMMYRQHFWHGHGIVRATAIAGIDLALWDILGKVRGVPCSKLWGGPVRDHVRTYCHLGGGKMEDFYETAAEDAKRFADLARQAVADGFTAFKCMAVPPTMPLEGLKPIRTAETCVAAMREAVGDNIDIMVDCHARPSPAMGLAVRQGARTVRPVLPRRAVLAGERRRPGDDQRGREHADRHRRARDEPRRVPRPVQRPRLRDLPARHHALRRLHRGPAHRRPGRGAPHRARPAQSAGTGQHRRARWSSASRSRATSSAKRSTPTCRGGRTWCRKASPSRRRAASCGRTRARASASRSTRPR